MPKGAVQTNDGHLCSDCGRSFDTKTGLISHENVADHEKLRQKDELRKLVESPDSEQHVYVIEIERVSDSERFYYVGVSNSIVSRLMAHLSHESNNPISMPDQEGRIRPQEYSMVRLVDTHPYEDRKRALNGEREEMLRLAIKTGRTDILGGR